MKSAVTLIATITLASALSGCAIGLGKGMHDYTMQETTSVAPGKKTRPIKVEAKENITFLTSNTYYADKAYQDLLNQCPRGSIVNIRTRHSTDLGFFAYREKIMLWGQCVE